MSIRLTSCPPGCSRRCHSRMEKPGSGTPASGGRRSSGNYGRRRVALTTAERIPALFRGLQEARRAVGLAHLLRVGVAPVDLLARDERAAAGGACELRLVDGRRDRAVRLV